MGLTFNIQTGNESKRQQFDHELVGFDFNFLQPRSIYWQFIELNFRTKRIWLSNKGIRLSNKGRVPEDCSTTLYRVIADS